MSDVAGALVALAVAPPEAATAARRGRRPPPAARRHRRPLLPFSIRGRRWGGKRPAGEERSTRSGRR